MAKRLNRSNLQVSETLVNFIENDALPNTNVSAERFWNKLELILEHFAPLNKKLLETLNYSVVLEILECLMMADILSA